MSTHSFGGRSAIVTGAASGIGRAAAPDLARRGAKVLVAGLQADAARFICRRVRRARLITVK